MVGHGFQLVKNSDLNNGFRVRVRRIRVKVRVRYSE